MRPHSRNNNQDSEAQSYPWHQHEVSEVLLSLATSENGLSSAKAAERLQAYGPNEFAKEQGICWWQKILRELRAPLSLVLLAACGATIFLGEYIDAGVIAVVLTIAVVLALWQEGKSSRAFAALARVQTARATVFRDGLPHEIDASGVVPGDIVELQAGAQVPADMRLLHAKHVTINEAALTGEWQPVVKDTYPVPVGTPLYERLNMAYKGTSVQSGYALGVVVATGENTAVGDIARNLREIRDEKTPLQVDTQDLSVKLLFIIVALIVVVAVTGLWFGQSLHDVLLLAIALSVAAIPEGLPAAVTIVLALGMESLLRRGGLVRSLLAAETLGATSYILTDKTGTLTEAKMHVAGVLTNSAENFDQKTWTKNIDTQELLATAYCTTDTYIEEVGGEKILRGESTERAITRVACTTNEGLVYLKARIDHLPFDPQNRFAAGLAQTGLGRRLCVTGAPELLLERATKMMADGESVKISKQARAHWEELLNKYSSAGARLIGVAYRTYHADVLSEQPDELLSGLTLMGVLVLHDPIRSGMREVITAVQRAGASVLLVTGDNAATALSVARAVGIAGEHEGVLTGFDIDELTDGELREVLTHAHVFARILPNQKMRLAGVLQQSGEIVAMTGDGVNDAPALRRANIGIALGSGTQVAKEAADLVLTHDSFATMYAAIEEGRRIAYNIRKIVAYLLSTSFTEMGLILTALIVGGAVPLLPVQILWANIIEEGLMTIAFAFEPGEKGAMRRRPHDLHEEGILSRDMIFFMAMVITVLSVLTISLYLFLRGTSLSIEELRSAMFLSVAVDSLFIAFSFRSLSVPVWRMSLWSNRFFLVALFSSLVLLLGALAFPFTRMLLSYTPLPGSIVLLIVVLCLLGLVLVELSKWLFFERQK